MALTAANVNVALTGAVYASEAGDTVTAPTTAVVALDTDLVDLGYIGEDGITEQYEEDTTEVRAWQGGAVVRTMISSSAARFSWQMIENKREVVELYHKGSIMESDGATGYKIEIMTPTGDRRAFVLDVIDGTDHIRIWIPDGEVTERGEINYSSSSQIGYPVTVTAYPNNNIVAVKFSDKASWAPAA